MLRASHRLLQLSSQLRPRPPKAIPIVQLSKYQSQAATAAKMSHLFEDATPQEIKDAKVISPSNSLILTPLTPPTPPLPLRQPTLLNTDQLRVST